MIFAVVLDMQITMTTTWESLVYRSFLMHELLRTHGNTNFAMFLTSQQGWHLHGTIIPHNPNEEMDLFLVSHNLTHLTLQQATCYISC